MKNLELPIAYYLQISLFSYNFVCLAYTEKYVYPIYWDFSVIYSDSAYIADIFEYIRDAFFYSVYSEIICISVIIFCIFKINVTLSHNTFIKNSIDKLLNCSLT